MNALRDVLESFLPRKRILNGTSLSEQGRSFTIRKEIGCGVVGARLEELPEEGKRCDAVFLCKAARSRTFGVVLVELKGGDVNKAIKQVCETSTMICRNGGKAPGLHKPVKLVEARKLGRHAGVVRAFIVARHGLTQRQLDKAKMLKKGIKLTIKSGKRLEIGCREVVAA